MNNIRKLIKELEADSLQASKASSLAEKNGILTVSMWHSGFRDACDEHIKKLKLLLNTERRKNGEKCDKK